jgi:hypothetical protein
MAKKQIKDSDLISEQETKDFTVLENTVEETTQDDVETADVLIVEQPDLEDLTDIYVTVDVMQTNDVLPMNPNGSVFTKNNDGSDIDGDIDTKNNSTFYEDEYKVLKRKYKQLEMQLYEYKRVYQQKEIDYNLISELKKSNADLRKLLSEKK